MPWPSRPTRRRFLHQGAAAGAAAALRPRPARAAATLRVLTWEGYADAEWRAAFEARTGATLVVRYAGSVDELFATAAAGGGRDIDLIMIDTSIFGRYAASNLLRPVDWTRVPNAARILPPFLELPTLRQGDARLGIPAAWGSQPLIYSEAAFPSPPDSWAVMHDPAYARRLLAQDDANNSIANCALLLGFPDPFQLGAAELAAVRAKLVAQKSLLLTYYTGLEEGVGAFLDGDGAAMFSIGEQQTAALRARGAAIGSIIPKEGGLGWIDCWAIAAGARDLDLAYAWIDVCLEPRFAALMSERHRYGTTTNAAANATLNLSYADRLTFLRPPESFERRVALWNEIKAA